MYKKPSVFVHDSIFPMLNKALSIPSMLKYIILYQFDWVFYVDISDKHTLKISTTKNPTRNIISSTHVFFVGRRDYIQQILVYESFDRCHMSACHVARFFACLIP